MSYSEFSRTLSPIFHLLAKQRLAASSQPFRFYRITEQEVLDETVSLVKPYTVQTANCMGNETVGQIIFEREPYSQDQTPPSLVFPPFYERNTKS